MKSVVFQEKSGGIYLLLFCSVTEVKWVHLCQEWHHWDAATITKTNLLNKLKLFCLSFLGAGASTTVNPFDPEPVRQTLGQMASGTLQPSLSYSASLPLPISQQMTSLPSSFTHPTHTGLELPQPLLPLSTDGAFAPQPAMNNQNPFLWGTIQVVTKREIELQSEGIKWTSPIVFFPSYIVA